jgi:hypothetical protein
VILDAARDVFLEDPKAPIAAVAERAGVGLGVLEKPLEPSRISESLKSLLGGFGCRVWIVHPRH